MAMNFDLLAPHYRWMEWILAGQRLQRARTAFLNRIPAPHHALLLGEGVGRCLLALLKSSPETEVACVDSSHAMLERCRASVLAAGWPQSQVRFYHADIRDWEMPGARFDLIISHYFLDCFCAQQVPEVVGRIARHASPDASWLVADFYQPPRGWRALRCRLILRVMYAFFRTAVQLDAQRLTPPDASLQANGFSLRERRLYEWSLLHSDWWQR